MRVAVLLAVYNGEKWIKEQIDSILNQTDVEIDIFISIDKSSDETLTIVNGYIERHKNITLISFEKRFGSAAPNFFFLIKSVDFNNYDYIALSDQDDIWFPTKVSLAISKLNISNSVGYSSDVLAIWPDGRKRLVKKSYPQKKYDYFFEGPGPGCSFVLNRKLALSLQEHLLEFDNYLSVIDWHDWFIYMFARYNGFKWIIDDQPLMYYRQHQQNQLGANTGLKAFKKRVSDVIDGYAISQTYHNLQALGCKNPFNTKQPFYSNFTFIYLFFNSFSCRRKFMDCMFFGVSCIIILFTWKNERK